MGFLFLIYNKCQLSRHAGYLSMVIVGRLIVGDIRSRSLRRVKNKGGEMLAVARLFFNVDFTEVYFACPKYVGRYG